MLSQKIKVSLNNCDKEEKLVELRDVQNVRSLFNSIKTFTAKIINGKRKTEINKEGATLVTSSKEVFWHNYYGTLFSVATKVDLIEFLKETGLPVEKEIQEIKQWLKDNKIKNIEIEYKENSSQVLAPFNNYWITFV
tara:strand:- start:1487 stop:1897 length:411 start_codon:yes stop_codon:yes gene_type:complete